MGERGERRMRVRGPRNAEPADFLGCGGGAASVAAAALATASLAATISTASVSGASFTYGGLGVNPWKPTGEGKVAFASPAGVVAALPAADFA